jgi:hypothetical protein
LREYVGDATNSTDHEGKFPLVRFMQRQYHHLPWLAHIDQKENLHLTMAEDKANSNYPLMASSKIGSGNESQAPNVRNPTRILYLLPMLIDKHCPVAQNNSAEH